MQPKLPPPCQTLQGKHYCLNCLSPICIIWSSDSHKNRDAKRRLTSEVQAQPALCSLKMRAGKNSSDGWARCSIRSRALLPPLPLSNPPSGLFVFHLHALASVCALTANCHSSHSLLLGPWYSSGSTSQWRFKNSLGSFHRVHPNIQDVSASQEGGALSCSSLCFQCLFIKPN